MTSRLASHTHKFRALAKELECDDSDAAFKRVVKKVAKPQPEKKAGA